MSQTEAVENFDTDEEYRAIEAALLETARGRWFLAEHGRRARRLDSALLEDAIGKLQTSIRQPPALLGQLQSELQDMKTFIATTRKDLFAKPAGMESVDLADPNKSSADIAPETAGSGGGTSILKAAEEMHELAWSLQTDHVNSENCETIARHASKIYALSHQHAVQSEKTLHMAKALDDTSKRLVAILETVGHELEVDTGGDPADLPGLSQMPAKDAS